MASVDGLDGLTLGRLAAALGISKSGLFAHWKDKAALQSEVIEHAGRQWAELVVRPAMQQPRGVRRLFAVHASRLDFYARRVLPGGCFFTTVYYEFESRPGEVREQLTEGLQVWTDLLISLAAQAVEAGELRPGTDPAQLAFEIDALGEAVVSRAGYFGAEAPHTQARRAVLERLRALCTDPNLLPEG
jgi:AcrR family transcriptional regulator